MGLYMVKIPFLTGISPTGRREGGFLDKKCVLSRISAGYGMLNVNKHIDNIDEKRHAGGFTQLLIRDRSIGNEKSEQQVTRSVAEQRTGMVTRS